MIGVHSTTQGQQLGLSESRAAAARVLLRSPAALAPRAAAAAAQLIEAGWYDGSHPPCQGRRTDCPACWLADWQLLSIREQINPKGAPGSTSFLAFLSFLFFFLSFPLSSLPHFFRF
jgi:hypothetical protein